jgi:hypothetical protein
MLQTQEVYLFRMFKKAQEARVAQKALWKGSIRNKLKKGVK